jgi:hypothetical protein
MRHVYVLIAVVALSLSCAAPRQTLRVQGAAPISDVKTSLYFPSRLCDLQKREMCIYPSRELGVSYEYSDNDIIKASFYVYNAGFDTISTGSKSPVVKNYFTQALQELLLMQKYGYYENVEIKSQTERPVDVNGDQTEALFAECSFVDHGISRESYVLLLGYKNQLFKVRYTFPVEVRDIGLTKWNCLLESFGDSTYCFRKKAL